MRDSFRLGYWLNRSGDIEASGSMISRTRNGLESRQIK